MSKTQCISKSFSTNQNAPKAASETASSQLFGGMNMSSSGFFATSSSSNAFKKQLGKITQNRDLVFANAMQRYQGLLERGEVAKNNYFEQRKKYIEELERKHEE